jgi:hypothetical protein
MAVTQISDIIVPSAFTSYTQLITQEKTKLLQSGAVSRDPMLDAFLAGGGNIETMPAFNDLSYSASNVSSDTGADSTPDKIGSIQQIVHRLSRNKSWATADLAGDLAGADPMGAIVARAGTYWARELQRMLMATLKGVTLANVAANGSDSTLDIKGAAYVAGTTNFQGEVFLDALSLKGDSFGEMGTLVVHSRVYFRMLKEDLITFMQDSTQNTSIPTYMGLRVVYDDGVFNASGVYHSYVLGNGSIRLGLGTPKVPTEVFRNPAAYNGGGLETLFNRNEFAIAPLGYTYAGSFSGGGASNTTLETAGSWTRVYPETKQVPMVTIITREHA